MSDSTLPPEPMPESAEAQTESTDQAQTPPWAPSPPQVHRYASAEKVVEAATKRFVTSAKHAVETHDRFIVVLGGDSQVLPVYRKLTRSPHRDAVPWNKTYFLFDCEPGVPPEDEASRYRAVREALLDPLEIPELHILRMKGEQTPAEAAQRYAVRIEDVFLCVPKKTFDLVLLGIGSDGTIAGLFPESPGLDVTDRWVTDNRPVDSDQPWLTLTYPALGAARHTVLLATGEERAEVVSEAFGGVDHKRPHPCERLSSRQGRREVLIDSAAASKTP